MKQQTYRRPLAGTGLLVALVLAGLVILFAPRNPPVPATHDGGTTYATTVLSRSAPAPHAP